MAWKLWFTEPKPGPACAAPAGVCILSAPTYLLTGATGYLGAEIAVQLLRRGGRCVALARPESAARAWQLLSPFADPGALVVLQGDLLEPECGIAAADVKALGRVDSVLHLAALPRFSGVPLETMRRIHVGGSEAVYLLAERLGARSFFHFSTAYVAGRFEGRFTEGDVDVGQSFRNPYEQTKLEAEVVLESLSKHARLPLTILRPSLVVGDGAAGPGQGRGLFGIIEIAQWFKARLDELDGVERDFTVRLPGDPAMPLNLIPLQTMTAMFLRILDSPGLWGKRYHLVHPESTPLGEVKACLEDLLDVRCVDIETGGADGDDAAPSEPLAARLFRRKMKPYFPYFLSAPSWSRDGLEAAIPDWRDMEAVALDDAFRSMAPAAGAPGGPAWVDEYFTRYIPDHMRDSAFDDVRFLDEIVGVGIPESDPPLRYMRFRGGRFELLPSSATFRPRCFFHLESGAFEGIVGGETAPQSAFFEKRVRISGDIIFALKLASLLEDFFRRHPYRAAGVTP